MKPKTDSLVVDVSTAGSSSSAPTIAISWFHYDASVKPTDKFAIDRLAQRFFSFSTLIGIAFLSLTVFTTIAAADPPESLWQVTVDTGGTRGQLAGVSVEGTQVIVAGTFGVDARGAGAGAAVHAYRRADGALSWSRMFQSDGTDVVHDMVTTPHTVYVVGTTPTTVDRAFHHSSFVLALATETGRSRWASRSCSGVNASKEAFFGVAVTGGRLFAVGSADRKILVRAYRASDGKTLWEDRSPMSRFSERATRVVATDDRIYVVGDRDTVLGRTAVYVARAYDATTGECLWESQFGQQVNTARGLALTKAGLVVAGYYWDIGPGVRRMEVRGLDSANGKVLWTDRPENQALSGATLNGLLALDKGTIIGGSVHRVPRTLPVIRSYDGTGQLLWAGDAGDLQYGVVNDLALFNSMVVAAGSAKRKAQPGHRHLWLRGHDVMTGKTLWEDLVPVGAADSAGLVLDADATHLTVAGLAESESGLQQWVIRLYGTRSTVLRDTTEY